MIRKETQKRAIAFFVSLPLIGIGLQLTKKFFILLLVGSSDVAKIYGNVFMCILSSLIMWIGFRFMEYAFNFNAKEDSEKEE